MNEKNIGYTKQHHTPHRWLPAKVIYPANSANRFSWLIRSTQIFLEECSDIDINCYFMQDKKNLKFQYEMPDLAFENGFFFYVLFY